MEHRSAGEEGAMISGMRPFSAEKLTGNWRSDMTLPDDFESVLNPKHSLSKLWTNPMGALALDSLNNMSS